MRVELPLTPLASLLMGTHGGLPDILQTIVIRKTRGAGRRSFSHALGSAEGQGCPDLEEPPRGFVRALRACVESGWTAVIAEVKKGSRQGVIRADFDPLATPRSMPNMVPPASRC